MRKLCFFLSFWIGLMGVMRQDGLAGDHCPYLAELEARARAGTFDKTIVDVKKLRIDVEELKEYEASIKPENFKDFFGDDSEEKAPQNFQGKKETWRKHAIKILEQDLLERVNFLGEVVLASGVVEKSNRNNLYVLFCSAWRKIQDVVRDEKLEAGLDQKSSEAVKSHLAFEKARGEVEPFLNALSNLLATELEKVDASAKKTASQPSESGFNLMNLFKGTQKKNTDQKIESTPERKSSSSQKNNAGPKDQKTDQKKEGFLTRTFKKIFPGKNPDSKNAG